MSSSPNAGSQGTTLFVVDGSDEVAMATNVARQYTTILTAAANHAAVMASW
jgi:hypothetical protein